MQGGLIPYRVRIKRMSFRPNKGGVAPPRSLDSFVSLSHSGRHSGWAAKANPPSCHFDRALGTAKSGGRSRKRAEKPLERRPPRGFAPVTSLRVRYPDSHRSIARECPLRGCLRPKHPLKSRTGDRKILKDGTSGGRERLGRFRAFE